MANIELELFGRGHSHRTFTDFCLLGGSNCSELAIRATTILCGADRNSISVIQRSVSSREHFQIRFSVERRTYYLRKRFYLTSAHLCILGAYTGGRAALRTNVTSELRVTTLRVRFRELSDTRYPFFMLLRPLTGRCLGTKTITPLTSLYTAHYSVHLQ